MDRQKFEQQFLELKKQDLDRDSIAQYNVRTMHANIAYIEAKGIDIERHFLAVTIEEMAEVVQQITKYMRRKYDHLSMIEEIADAEASIPYAQEVLDILPGKPDLYDYGTPLWRRYEAQEIEPEEIPHIAVRCLSELQISLAEWMDCPGEIVKARICQSISHVRLALKLLREFCDITKEDMLATIMIKCRRINEEIEADTRS